MKNKKTSKKSIIAIISILAIIGVSGILAYFTDTKNVTNKVTLGKVEIELTEYTMNGETKEVWADVDGVLPGDTISKIPEISCATGSAPCYVRAKVEFSCDNDELDIADALTTSSINVDNTKWYYCTTDGYYYYKEVLTTESTPAQLFTEVTIPTSLNNDWSLEELDIKVTAEAVQSAHVTGTFTDGTTQPWGDVTGVTIVAAK